MTPSRLRCEGANRYTTGQRVRQDNKRVRIVPIAQIQRLQRLRERYQRQHVQLIGYLHCSLHRAQQVEQVFSLHLHRVDLQVVVILIAHVGDRAEHLQEERFSVEDVELLADELDDLREHPIRLALRIATDYGGHYKEKALKEFGVGQKLRFFRKFFQKFFNFLFKNAENFDFFEFFENCKPKNHFNVT